MSKLSRIFVALFCVWLPLFHFDLHYPKGGKYDTIFRGPIIKRAAVLKMKQAAFHADQALNKSVKGIDS